MKQKHNSVKWLGAIGAIGISLTMVAAQGGSISGMYVFPKGNQSPEQQQDDDMQCHNSAVQMTGYNPSAPPPTSQAQTGSGVRGGVRGAARGAAAGAAMGAIAGDAGKGAAMGAAGGGVLGGARGRQESKQQQAAQGQQQQQEYQRAFSACMDARGYSVK